MRISTKARMLAARTRDAFSAKRYSSWEAVAEALLVRGYTVAGAEAIMRSKLTRWAADRCTDRRGRATSADLMRYMDKYQRDVQQVLRECAVNHIFARLAP